MIPFNFEYYRPASLQDAVRLFGELSRQGKEPLYYSGGTEIITMARRRRLFTRAVIDVKNVPECGVFALGRDRLLLGSCLALSRIHDSRVFPLLGETAAGVADRTSRNKITLGGNLCSRIMYREAVLPLLLTDSELRMIGPGGARQVPIGQVFDGQLRLGPGELFVQSLTDTKYLDLPYVTVKRRKVADIDYPLVTVAALRADSQIRVAFSGLCAFPFRSAGMEAVLNRRDAPLETRIEEALARLPAPVLSNIQGSAGYRIAVLKLVLDETLRQLGGE